jgi:hypothetical protein
LLRELEQIGLKVSLRWRRVSEKGFPAFGILLILVGIFLLINTVNGNLINLIQGKLQFNFTPPSSSSNKIPTGSGGATLFPIAQNTLTGNLNKSG